MPVIREAGVEKSVEERINFYTTLYFIIFRFGFSNFLVLFNVANPVTEPPAISR